jgi:4-hydroxybenzoate polyprenyltransferase
MEFLSSVFRFYIHASIHIAFAALALVGVTEIQYDIEVSKAVYVLVFFGTISGYNFVKYVKIGGLYHSELTRSFRSIQIFSLVCFAIAFAASFWLSFAVLLVLCLLVLLTFFYVTPFLIFKSLRNISSAKIFVVAIVWAGTTVLLPILSTSYPTTTAVLLTFLQRFLILISLIIPFEIRDLKYDATSLKTVPQRLGVQKTKRLGVGLLLVCLLMEGVKGDFDCSYFLSLLIMCALLAAGIISSSKNQKKYFASFWIEAISIVWFVLLFVLSNLF